MKCCVGSVFFLPWYFKVYFNALYSCFHQNNNSFHIKDSFDKWNQAYQATRTGASTNHYPFRSAHFWTASRWRLLVRWETLFGLRCLAMCYKQKSHQKSTQKNKPNKESRSLKQSLSSKNELGFASTVLGIPTSRQPRTAWPKPKHNETIWRPGAVEIHWRFGLKDVWGTEDEEEAAQHEDGHCHFL